MAFTRGDNLSFSWGAPLFLRKYQDGELANWTGGLEPHAPGNVTVWVEPCM